MIPPFAPTHSPVISSYILLGGYVLVCTMNGMSFDGYIFLSSYQIL